MSRIQRFIICSVFFVLTTAPVFGHPSHSSTTEVEWNKHSGRFEVAMQLSIADLEDAISLKQRSRFHLETDTRRKTLVQKYLQEHFSIALGGDDLCRLHWVGCELELHDVWIYFEAEAVPHNIDPDSPSSADTTMPKSKKVNSWDELFSEGKPNRRRCPSSHETPPAVQIRNTALMEVQPEQTNIVLLTLHGRSTSVVLTPEARQIVIQSASAGSPHRSASAR